MALDNIVLSDNAQYILSKRALDHTELAVIRELTELVKKSPLINLPSDKLEYLAKQIIKPTHLSYSELAVKYIAFGIDRGIRGYAHKERKDIDFNGERKPAATHPYKVAKMLATFSARYVSLISGFLHDFIEEQADKKPLGISFDLWSNQLIKDFSQQYDQFGNNLFNSLKQNPPEGVRYLYPDAEFSAAKPIICNVILRMTHNNENGTYFDYLSRLLGIGDSSRRNKKLKRKNLIIQEKERQSKKQWELTKFEAIARSSTIKLVDMIDTIDDYTESVLVGRNNFPPGQIAFAIFKILTYWNYATHKIKFMSEENRRSYLYTRLQDVTQLLQEIAVYDFGRIINYYDEQKLLTTEQQKSIKHEVLEYMNTPESSRFSTTNQHDKYGGLVLNQYLPAFTGRKELVTKRKDEECYRDIFLFREYLLKSKTLYPLFGLRTK